MVASLNIALVEDNDELRDSIADALSGAKHKVVALDCAEALPEAAAFNAFDLIIIDINLPGENGFSLAKRIRQSHSEVGIIIMTARNESRDKREGYAVGADMYMTKPLELDELLAAIDSLARRLFGRSSEDHELIVDKHHMTLSNRKGDSIRLTSAEMSLMVAFSLSIDLRLEKWQIIEILKKEETEDPVRTLVIVIVRLRKKLQTLGVGETAIQVIRGWGYQLCTTLKIL